MATQFFVTGIGTGIGKTLISAILVRALNADYWKPVQAGFDGGTDTDFIKNNVPGVVIHPEVYKLQKPASPHIAAREEAIEISIQNIAEKMPTKNRNLIVEGPGGIMVPLNSQQFVTDLIQVLNLPVILVSRNYLGSINHSLLTSRLCKQLDIPVAGWIFNDQYLSYEQEIVSWSGFQKIASIPFAESCDEFFIEKQANMLREQLADFI